MIVGEYPSGGGGGGGVQAGFWLVSIDGKPVKGLSLTEVRVLLLVRASPPTPTNPRPYIHPAPSDPVRAERVRRTS